MRYLLHGLRVSSDLPIPGLQPVQSERSVDLRIWLQAPFHDNLTSGPPTSWSGRSETWFETSSVTPSGEPQLTAIRICGGSHYRIAYCDGIEFVINREASEVWVSWPAGLTVRDVPTYLLGPIIGVILRLRGTTCLHASAIEVDGRAVVFAGPAGAGKSTTAGAFAVRRFPVMSDDTIGLTASGSTWTVAPGYPRLRLWPESAQALAAEAGSSALLPPGESGSTSRYHLDLTAPGYQFQRESLPLGVVYLLEERGDKSIAVTQPVAAAEALMALIGNTFASGTLDREMRGREFDVLGRLVECVPIRRLRRPTDLACLPQFCESVLNDLASLGFERATALAR